MSCHHPLPIPRSPLLSVILGVLILSAGSPGGQPISPDDPSFQEEILPLSDTIPPLETIDTVPEAPLPNDSLVPADTLAVTTPADSLLPPDTLQQWENAPSLTFGAGWRVGSFPPFDLWQNNLPENRYWFDSVAPVIVVPLTDTTSDTVDIQLDVKEDPNTYNITIPLFAGIVFPVTHRFHLGVQVSGSGIYKTWQAAFDRDSLENALTIRQTLAVGAVEIRLQGYRELSHRFFTIESVDRSTLTAGIGLTPLCYIRRSSSAKNRGSSSAFADSVFAHLARTVKQHLRSTDSYGFGISWHAGLYTLRSLNPRASIGTELAYHGSHHRFPDLPRKKLSRSLSFPNRDLSYTIHRLSLAFTLLVHRKPDTTGNE